MRTGIGVYELGVDPYTVRIALHRTFDDVLNAEVLADLLGIYVLALESKCSVACDDEAIGVSRHSGSEIFCNGVGKIILA